MGGTKQSGGALVTASAGRQDGPVSHHAESQRPDEQLSNVSRTEHTYTIADLYGLPAVVPVAVADDILGIGSTLSKGLRAAGRYPVPLLHNRGRHHAVSLANLLTYLGLPLPTPTATATGEVPPPEERLIDRANVENGEGTAA